MIEMLVAVPLFRCFALSGECFARFAGNVTFFAQNVSRPTRGQSRD